MNASMDWALIDIPEERRGENVVSLNYRFLGFVSTNAAMHYRPRQGTPSLDAR